MTSHYKQHFYSYLQDIAEVEKWKIPEEINSEARYKLFLTHTDSERKFEQFSQYYMGLDEYQENISGTLTSLSLISHHLWHWHDATIDFPDVTRELMELYRDIML